MIKAQVTRYHSLQIDQTWPSVGSPIEPVPWADKAPGTWIAWIIDGGKLMPNCWFELGFGAFQPDFKRQAYKKAAWVLQMRGVQIAPLETLQWQDEA